MAHCCRCNKKGIFMKLTQSGLCIECAEQKILDLETLLTPEHRDYADLSKLCNEQRQELAQIKNEIDQKRITLNGIKKQIHLRSSELIVVDDALEMESFSLYIPKYSFSSSEEYKEALTAIREKQKQMIKNQQAAVCRTEWSVEGSRAKGRAITNEMIKLFLRSFNNECDIAVQSVKFNNFDRCSARIEKSFQAINKLGKTNTISLSPAYKELKLDELKLAYEYQRKKQEEKEELAALRAQQREDAKLAKEIEAARKEAEKEKKHYQQARDKLRVQLAAAPSVDHADLLSKQEELMNHLEELEHRMEDIDYRISNQRAGYVYIISNIGSFGEGVFKIGMTRRLDPMERVFELGDASVPFRFDVHAMIFSDDAPKLEAALHQAFASKRVNAVNHRREYFRVSLDEIKAVVKENHDKTVEFFDIPEAQQYRESLRLHT